MRRGGWAMGPALACVIGLAVVTAKATGDLGWAKATPPPPPPRAAAWGSAASGPAASGASEAEPEEALAEACGPGWEATWVWGAADLFRASPCASPYCECASAWMRCEHLTLGAAARALLALRWEGPIPPAASDKAAAGAEPKAATASAAPQPHHHGTSANDHAHRHRVDARPHRPRRVSFRGSALRELHLGGFDGPFFGKVRELVLAQMGLRRVRTGALRGLHSLRTLDLSGNELRTLPVPALAATPALTSLDLSVNNLAAIPDGTFAGASLRHLRSLRLHGNPLRLVGPRAFHGLPRLRQLDLAACYLTHLPPPLVRPAHALVRLDLGDNSFSATASVPTARKVLKIRLREGRLAGLPARAFASTSEPARITSLSLGSNAIARVHGDAFEGLNFLRVLDLSRNQISHLPPDTFRHCPELKHLFLSRNRLTRLHAFVHLGGLSFLDLSRNRMTELMEATFPGEGPSSLLALHLEQNGIRHVSPFALERLSSLRVLFLSQNVLRSLPTEVLDSCPHLGLLDMSGNSMSNARAARRLARVPHLILSNNRLMKLPGSGPRRRDGNDSLPTRVARTARPPIFPKRISKVKGGHEAPEELHVHDSTYFPWVSGVEQPIKQEVRNKKTKKTSKSPDIYEVLGVARPRDRSSGSNYNFLHPFKASSKRKHSKFLDSYNIVDGFKHLHRGSKANSEFPAGIKDYAIHKSSDKSKYSDISKHPFTSDVLDTDEFEEISLSGDITLIPDIFYSAFNVPQLPKPPYALDSAHASKTTDSSYNLDPSDEFDASESFDTPATRATRDVTTSAFPDVKLNNPSIAPSNPDFTQGSDSLKSSENHRNTDSPQTSNQKIPRSRVVSDNPISQNADKIVNIFQPVTLCNATKPSNVTVASGAAAYAEKLSSGVSAIGDEAKTTTFPETSQGSSASNTFVETNKRHSDSDPFFQDDPSSDCTPPPDNQSEFILSYGDSGLSSVSPTHGPKRFSAKLSMNDGSALSHLSPTETIPLGDYALDMRPLVVAKGSAGAKCHEPVTAAGYTASAADVQQIDYSSNGIFRVAPDAFHGFCGLRRLNLADNMLRRLPAAAIRELRELADLDVSGNNISRLDFLKDGGGSLLVLDASRNALHVVTAHAFASLRVLQVLDLSENALILVHPGAFSPLLELEKLSLAHNFLSELPEDTLSHSANLEAVDLSYNQLSKLNFLRSKSMQILDLSFNQIERIDAGSFVKVPFLRHLDLGDNEISFIEHGAFTGLRALQFLNLAINSISQLPNYVIQPLRNLQVLSLAKNKLSSLTHLTFAVDSNNELLELDISENQLSTIHPRAFHQLSELRMLNISFNQIQTLSKYTFCRNLELTELDLSENIPNITIRLDYASPLMARASLFKALKDYFSSRT